MIPKRLDGLAQGDRQWPRVEVSRGDDVAKRTARKITKPSRKVSKTSFKAIKKQAKKRAATKKSTTKRPAKRYEAPTRSLKGREARSEERFRELAAWYLLQGMDEAAARQHAQNEMDDDTRKD
jgi:hypothetical protein